MRCSYPIINGSHAHACGQCMACRFNRRREWTNRLMLEATQHKDNSFLTLTYNDFWMPRVSSSSHQTVASGTLMAVHLQNWLKRLRKAISPLKIRYYAVGEYGDESQRPHYHVALFGYRGCRYYQTSPGTYLKNYKHCCVSCDLLNETWTYGRVFQGTLERDSMQYVAGYVTKKMTKTDDPRLFGRVPEFARMSLRPGIGVGAMHDVASTFLQFNLEKSQSDVPVTLAHGNRHWPLGRTLRRKLRELVGRDPNAPASVIIKQQEEMRPLLEIARELKKNTSLPFEMVFREEVIKQGENKRLRLETRNKLYKTRKTL